MNGRGINPGSSSSEKNLIFNNIRYVKPVYFLKDEQKETHNLYYDNNPYFMNNNLLSNRGKGIYNTSRHSNSSRDASQTSSQRSSKVVRANGLRLAEKPRIIKGLIPQRSPNLTQSRNHEQTKRLFDRNIELEQENRFLREQNNRLKDNMRIIEDMHRKQVDGLNFKFQTLLKKTQQLESQFLQDEDDWKRKVDDMSHIKTSNHSQFNPISNANGGSINSTPKQYYNPKAGYSTANNNNARK